MAIGATMAALNIASSVLGGIMGRRKARAENEYRYRLQIQRNQQYAQQIAYQRQLMAAQSARYRAQAKAAKTRLEGQYTDTLEAIAERKENAASQINNIFIQSQNAQGADMARRGESLTEGNSVVALQQQFQRNQATLSEVQHNALESFMRRSQNRLKTARDATAAQLAGSRPMPMAPIAPPDQLQQAQGPTTAGLLMNIGSNIAQGYMSGASLLPNDADFSLGAVLFGQPQTPGAPTGIPQQFLPEGSSVNIITGQPLGG